MAAPAMPPLNWTCPVCGQPVPAGQACPNCAAGTGAPPATPQRPPRHQRQAPQQPAPAPAQTPAAQQPAQPAAPRAPHTAPANPPPAAQPAPRRHGGNLQYQQRLTGVSVDRNENLINHNWYRFLLWMLGIGGLAFLAWLFYGGFLLGWHANPCKDPCPATSAAAPAPAKAIRTTPAPAVRKTASRPVASTVPRQVQVSGSLDLVHHTDQRSAAPAPTPTRRLTPEELDEATARWLENQ